MYELFLFSSLKLLNTFKSNFLIKLFWSETDNLKCFTNCYIATQNEYIYITVTVSGMFRESLMKLK